MTKCCLKSFSIFSLKILISYCLNVVLNKLIVSLYFDIVLSTLFVPSAILFWILSSSYEESCVDLPSAQVLSSYPFSVDLLSSFLLVRELSESRFFFEFWLYLFLTCFCMLCLGLILDWLGSVSFISRTILSRNII